MRTSSKEHRNTANTVALRTNIASSSICHVSSIKKGQLIYQPEHAATSRRKLLKKSSQAEVAIAATSAGLGKIEIPLRRRHNATTL